MSLYFNRVFKPSVREYLNVIPGKKSILGCVDVLCKLLKPGAVVYPNITCVLTTYCTLKCAKCNNLIPFFENPYHIPVGQVIEDIDNLLLYSDCCMKLGFLGGEPFIYPDLSKIVEHYKNNPKVMCVEFVTNATVIPDNDLLDSIASMKNPRIAISDYGVKSQKPEELYRKCKEKGIYCERNKSMTWFDPGGVENRGKTREQLKKEYNDCYSARYCRTLMNGKLYTCARAASLADLGYMDDSHDSIDIRKNRSEREFRRDMRAFLTVDYADACNYCDHIKHIVIPAGEQL